MKIFITGATGYIGSAVAEKLKLRGHEILALVRSSKSATTLQARGYHTIIGDMTIPEQWKKEAANADGFIHCAQMKFGKRIGSGWVRKAAQADQVAFSGMIEAARLSESCKAIIYTSGISVVGDYGDNWTDENTVLKHGETVGSYHVHGEQLAHDAHRQGLPVVILRPSLPVSAGGTFAEFFLTKAEKGNLQYVGNGRNFCPTVHLDDLADAYALAVENPKPGETFIITDNDPLTIEEFSNTLMRKFGNRNATSAPYWIVALFGGRPLANLLVSSYRVSNAKAKRILGWSPRCHTFQDALKEIVSQKEIQHTTTSLNKL